MKREPMHVSVYGMDGIDEVIDINTGYALESTVRSRYPRNACGYCGRLHPTEGEGWRNEKGEKVPCETCKMREVKK
jgi:hypothetical protein